MKIPPDLVDTIKAKYGLTYQIPYYEQFISEIAIEGLDVLEVGGAMPSELVIDFSKVNSWTSIESPDY